MPDLRALLPVLLIAGLAGAPLEAAGQSPAARLSGIFAREPTVREVQDAALRYYRLEPARVHGLAAKARWKGLVPEVELSVDQTRGDTYSSTRDGLYPVLPNPPENPNPSSYKERVNGRNDSRTWRVRATWILDRTVFNAEALDAKSLVGLQENLVREVTMLYFARKRLVIRLVLAPPDDPEELYYEVVRLEELTATLDALTGGMFGKRAWRWE